MNLFKHGKSSVQYKKVQTVVIKNKTGLHDYHVGAQ